MVCCNFFAMDIWPFSIKWKSSPLGVTPTQEYVFFISYQIKKKVLWKLYLLAKQFCAREFFFI